MSARPRQPQFQAPRPNALWVSDFTYVATWAGLVYVAFVIGANARRIVGWRVSRTARAGFVLDALEQALHERRRAIDNVVFQIRTEIADAARKLADERGEPPEDLEA